MVLKNMWLKKNILLVEKLPNCGLWQSCHHRGEGGRGGYVTPGLFLKLDIIGRKD